MALLTQALNGFWHLPPQEWIFGSEEQEPYLRETMPSVCPESYEFGNATYFLEGTRESQRLERA